MIRQRCQELVGAEPRRAPRPVRRSAPQAARATSALQAEQLDRWHGSGGNAAFCSLLAASRTAREADPTGSEPDQLRPEDAEPRTDALQVSAVYRGGSAAPGPTRVGPVDHQRDPDVVVSGQAVGPLGVPTVHAGGGNDCTPALERLFWHVVDAGSDWRADVLLMLVSGDIHITAWPSAPTSMTVPNTPNPVDGGNISNTAGSANRWQAAIDDMADYDTAGSGGAGANWHDTAASSAHEWAHWNSDYLADTIPTADWRGANSDIDAMTVPKATHADAAAARTALQPAVDARFQAFVRAASARWNAIINGTDRPGRGGRGYAAGMVVLNRHIGAVRSYAAGKGWTGAGP